MLFDSKLAFYGLTFESKGWRAIDLGEDAAIRALNCDFYGVKIPTLHGYGTCELQNCRVVAVEKDGFPSALDITEGGCVAADCEFVGGVVLTSTKEARLERCSIRDCGKGYGVEVGGEYQGTDAPRCEIVDCRIENCYCGVHTADRASVVVRGGEIRGCRSKEQIGSGVQVFSLEPEDAGSATLENVKIVDCDYAVWLGEGGRCDATRVVFSDVDSEWFLNDGAVAIFNGKRAKA